MGKKSKQKKKTKPSKKSNRKAAVSSSESEAESEKQKSEPEEGMGTVFAMNCTLDCVRCIYCKTRIFSAQFILALLAHSFVCAKIHVSSALNFHIVYVHKTYEDQYYGTPIPLNSVIGSTLSL